MDKETLYVSVDVGTTKVCTLVGLAHLSGSMEIIGSGIVPSRGLSKGVIVNIPEATEAIHVSLEEAARSSGQIIKQVYATVTGTHLDFSTRWGSIHSPHYSVPISYGEVDHAVEAAYPADMGPERQVLHLVPRTYAIDGLKGVRNPIGMHALRLDVETLCVTGGTLHIQNLIKAIEHNHVKVNGLIMSGLAAAESVLTRDEREIGVMLIEIGGGVTTLAAFNQDSLAAAGVLPVGGYNCTNDIAVALSTPPDVAEELKVRHGTLNPQSARNERVDIKSFGDGNVGLSIDRGDLSRYMLDRMEEIMRMIQYQAKNMGYPAWPPAGVVLTGGTAATPGMQVFARRAINAPVRIGTPRGVEGLPVEMATPAYSAVVGTLLWGARNHVFRMQKRGIFSGKPPKAAMEGEPATVGASSRPISGEVQAKALAWLKERAKRVAL